MHVATPALLTGLTALTAVNAFSMVSFVPESGSVVLEECNNSLELWCNVDRDGQTYFAQVAKPKSLSLALVQFFPLNWSPGNCRIQILAQILSSHLALQHLELLGLVVQSLIG